MPGFILGVVGLEQQGDVITPAALHMPVHCVMADVQFAILEPSNVDRVEGPVCNLGRFLEPIEPRSLIGPKAIGVAQAATIAVLILVGRAVCIGISRRRLRHQFAFARNLFGHALSLRRP